MVSAEVFKPYTLPTGKLVIVQFGKLRQKCFYFGGSVAPS